MSIYDETVEQEEAIDQEETFEEEDVEEEIADEDDAEEDDAEEEGDDRDLEDVLDEIEAEHCTGNHAPSPAPVPRAAYEATSVLELDRIQKSKHEAIFKGSGPITQVSVLMGNDYKNFDIGDPHVITVAINPQQMTINEAPAPDEADDDQMTIEDIDESEDVEDDEDIEEADEDGPEPPVPADDDERPWPIDADSEELV